MIVSLVNFKHLMYPLFLLAQEENVSARGFGSTTPLEVPTRCT